MKDLLATEWLPLAIAATTLFFVVLALGFVLALWRSRPTTYLQHMHELLAGQERLENSWRTELADGQRALRAEIAQSHQALRMELGHADEQFRSVVSRDAASGRQEAAEALDRFGQGFAQRLKDMFFSNEQRMADLRGMVEQRLIQIQTDNASKLEQMRQTVDEKLHATLEQRLGESFKLVSDRLEAVHKGLGEMHTLAAGVGDLKRVLTNVKSRGTWGEVQLARLIEDTMTADQYGCNVKPVPGSDAVVEFAIRLPGQKNSEEPVWLPIDAKFPKEEYERLHDAQDMADVEAVRQASAALGRAIEVQAKLITAKYISPPHTTDFAIMFLPSEGLYAEVLRLPGVLDKLHDLRVNVAGPANLAAMLNSLQMGFRTLAIEQRSSEVWQVLRSVKTEFGKFGQSLADVKRSLESATNKIGKTETRTRVMLRSLSAVEALPSGNDSEIGQDLLPKVSQPLIDEEDEKA